MDGSFAENVTSSGSMNEKTVCIGDIYSIGSCEIQVSMPRFPCWKNDEKHGIKNLNAKES